MHMLRFLTSGESHGPELVAVVEGVLAGFDIDLARLNDDLARRQKGYGRGGRMASQFAGATKNTTDSSLKHQKRRMTVRTFPLGPGSIESARWTSTSIPGSVSRRSEPSSAATRSQSVAAPYTTCMRIRSILS